jgi:SAM-dependent methyltransferase
MASLDRIAPISRLRLYVSMARYGNAHNQDFAREHYAFFADMQARLQQYVGDLRNLRVLDVGCGKAFWLTLLLHSYGAHATGIDTEFVAPGRSLGKCIGILRRNGLERAVRTLVWEMIYAAPYYRELAAACPFPLRFEGIDVRHTSVTKLAFAGDTFDLVVSHEVFEHLSDVPAALRSLRRVMKPDGIVYIYMHNYTSLSGGHHIAWKYPDTKPSTVVPPWDHLRQNRYPEIPSWINRLRERDYRQAFEDQFEILDWFPTATEGEALLTPEIRAELAKYSKEELLTKGFVVIAKPKAVMRKTRGQKEGAINGHY